jgi:hypothetical protein
MPVYTTAKAAVHGMTRSFARDLGPHRIRVNTVVPGWVMTERQRALWATPEALERHRARQCLPDLVEPVHLARMVLFLASDAMCVAACMVKRPPDPAAQPARAAACARRRDPACGAPSRRPLSADPHHGPPGLPGFLGAVGA